MSSSSPALPSSSQSASQLYQQSRAAQRFLTRSDLDALFQLVDSEQETSGLPVGHVLHLTGLPGSGKSHFCASLALNAPVDAKVHVLIIDTSDGVLRPQELSRMARGRFDGADLQSVKQGIHRIRIASQADLLALVYGGLRAWLAAHPLVKLIIVDSLSSLLRSTSFLETNCIQSSASTSALSQSSSQWSSNQSMQNRFGSQTPNGSPSTARFNESKAEQRNSALADWQNLMLRLTTGPSPCAVVITSQMHTHMPKESGNMTLMSQIPQPWMTPKTFTVLLRQETEGQAREKQAWLQTSPHQNHAHLEVTFKISDIGVVPHQPVLEMEQDDFDMGDLPLDSQFLIESSQLHERQTMILAA